MLSDVLNAEVYNNLLKVSCHLFTAPGDENLAYFDLAPPLIYKQTISQPYIVSLMTQTAELGKIVLPFAEFSLSEVNCLTKNKNETLEKNYFGSTVCTHEG